MEDLVATKKNSLELIGADSMQAETGTPETGGGLIWPKTRKAKCATYCVILCMVSNFWINSDHAFAYELPSSESVAVEVDRSGFSSFQGGSSGILENSGLVTLVSGLSPYLAQGLPDQTRMPEDCACLRVSNGREPASEQRQIPSHIGFLAGLLLCGLIYWGGAVWVDRR